MWLQGGTRGVLQLWVHPGHPNTPEMWLQGAPRKFLHLGVPMRGSKGGISWSLGSSSSLGPFLTLQLDLPSSILGGLLAKVNPRLLAVAEAEDQAVELWTTKGGG